MTAPSRRPIVIVAFSALVLLSSLVLHADAVPLASTLLKTANGKKSHFDAKNSAQSPLKGNPNLPSSLNINPNTLTISGISAGAAMAIQFQYAFSRIVKGAGIVAGIPYMCAQNMMAGALDCMDMPYIINEQTLEEYLALYEADNLIDSTNFIQNQTVFLFSGTADTVVYQGTMQKVIDMIKFYKAYNVQSYLNYSAEHAWITNFYGNACNYLGEPYVNNCGLDFAGEFLAQAFQDMAAQGNNPGTQWVPQAATFQPLNMVAFDQTPYGANPLIGMDYTGYVYVPTNCSTGKNLCHIHVNFHGCNQQATKVGTQYVEHTGLNEWGEANNIVILYPQTLATDLPMNPQGCFDWWGFAGSNYATREGPQMNAIRNMITALGHF